MEDGRIGSQERKETSTVKTPRALIIAGLSTALLTTAVSSASAATISPASADFGRLLIGKTSAPKTFTVTVGSGDRCRSPGPSGDCYPIQPDPDGFVLSYRSIAFLDRFSSGTCHQVIYLTPAAPSCTITVIFEPEVGGPLSGDVFPNEYDSFFSARVTGIGLLSRKAIYCRSPKKGGIYKKKFSRWCENRKKKRK